MDKEVGKELTERLIQSRCFYPQSLASSGKPFFTFIKFGDFLKGELLGKQGRHIARTCSYTIAVEAARQAGENIIVKDGQIEEFCANAQVQKIIDKNQLIHSIVRIVYVGKFRPLKALHSMKVYRVFKEYGVFTKDERERSAKMPKRRPFKERIKR